MQCAKFDPFGSAASARPSASASDVLGQSAARAAKHFSVSEITEATALALMEDMLLSAK